MGSDQESPHAVVSRMGLDAAVLLARAGWLVVADQILSGISHDLLGRVASLDALARLCQIQGSEPPPIESFLEGEVKKLQRQKPRPEAGFFYTNRPEIDPAMLIGISSH